MQLSRILLNVGSVVILALTVSACGTSGPGSRIPEPEWAYRWSQPVQAEMPDGKIKWVRCITVNDKNRLDDYIEGMNMIEEVSQ